MKLIKMSSFFVLCLLVMGSFSFPLSARPCHKTKKVKSRSTNWSFNFDLNPFTLCKDYSYSGPVVRPTYIQPVMVEQPIYYTTYPQPVLIQQPTYIQRTYVQPQYIYVK